MYETKSIYCWVDMQGNNGAVGHLLGWRRDWSEETNNSAGELALAGIEWSPRM